MSEYFLIPVWELFQFKRLLVVKIIQMMLAGAGYSAMFPSKC